jgi:hypothetical protein
VTDSPGARNYVTDRKTGLLGPPGNTEVLTLVAWALDPRNAAEVDAIRERSQRVVRTQFTPLRYLEASLTVTVEAVRELAG